MAYYKYGTNLNDRIFFTSTVLSNNKAKRFFSNVESEIYFGDKRMDDINKFDFGIDEKVLPLYGYNCFYPAELVSGQRIVQGQFVVNFTDRQLIQDTLSSIDDSVYKTIVSPEYSPGGGNDKAIWDKEFDIMLGYGNYSLSNETYGATCQSIIGAKISGMQKVTDTSGQPLLEVYNFIAKDFVEEEIKKVDKDTDDSPAEEKDKNNSPDNLKYICSDVYNHAEVTSNSKYCSKNKSTIHLIHDIIFNNSEITIKIQTGNKNSLKILDGTLAIMEKLDESVVIPKLKYTTTSKSVATIDLKKQYSDILNKERQNKTNKISCSLSYTVSVDINGKSQEFKVSYQDAYIYL